MKKTIALCVVLCLLSFGCCVLAVKLYPHKFDSTTTEKSTTTIILTTAEQVQDTTSAKTEEETDMPDNHYTKKEMQQILYDYAAEHCVNYDAYKNNIFDFTMLDNGYGAAVCTNQKQINKSGFCVYVYTTKDYGKTWEISKQLFGCEDCEFMLIYFGSDILLIDSNNSFDESYIYLSNDGAESFTSLESAKLLENQGEFLPTLYPELLGCDYENKTFILGWKISKEDSEYSLIVKYTADLKTQQTIYKNTNDFEIVVINGKNNFNPHAKSTSVTFENCAEALTVLKNYALGRPVAKKHEEKILHYSMKENGKGVAVYGEYGGMHHVYTCILYTEDFGKNWQISNEFYSYTSGVDELVYTNDRLIFLNYNSVAFSSYITISKDHGKTFTTVLLSDLLGYKGATALSLYPEVKQVDEKGKTITVNWHSITDKKTLLTQKYDLDFNVIETITRDDAAIEQLIKENSDTSWS